MITTEIVPIIWILMCFIFNATGAVQWIEATSSSLTYMVESEEVLTWASARQACLDLGGTLAQVTDETTYLDITSEFSVSSAHWVDGNDNVEEGEFRLEDGTLHNYRGHFATDDPNNVDKKGSNGPANCLQFEVNELFMDDICDHLHHYICQIGGDETTTITTTEAPTTTEATTTQTTTIAATTTTASPSTTNIPTTTTMETIMTTSLQTTLVTTSSSMIPSTASSTIQSASTAGDVPFVSTQDEVVNLDTTDIPSPSVTYSTPSISSGASSLQTTSDLSINQIVQTAYPFVNSSLTPWGVWLPWSRCSRSCDGGHNFRARINLSGIDTDNSTASVVIRIDENIILTYVENQTCNTTPCPTTSQWGEWSPWNKCTSTCGEGTKRRVRRCHGYNDCPGKAYNLSICLIHKQCPDHVYQYLSTNDDDMITEADERASAISLGSVVGLAIPFTILCLILCLDVLTYFEKRRQKTKTK